MGETDDDLPQALAPRHKKKMPKNIKRNVLDDFEKRYLREGLAGMLRNLEEPGYVEWVEARMTDESAAAVLTEKLGFPVGRVNVQRMREVEYGKLRVAPVAKGVKGALTAALEARLQELEKASLQQEEAMARALVSLNAAVSAVGAFEKRLDKFEEVFKGWRQVVPEHSRRLDKAEADIARIDKDTVKKAHAEELAAAFSTQRERPVIGSDRLSALRDKYTKKDRE